MKDNQYFVFSSPVVVVWTKDSQSWHALETPQIMDLSGLRFLCGLYRTGNPEHRFEGNMCLIRFESITTIIEATTVDAVFTETLANSPVVGKQ